MNSKLSKRALNLSYFTIIYNIAEGILSIFAGLTAGSISLIGFGLDSAVESLSAMVITWRFRKHGKISELEEEKVEKRALKYIGYTFFILAIYVFYESIKKIYTSEISEPSILGILITVASLIVMPILFYFKYQTGKALKSSSLIADSKQTIVCMFLSAAVLIGLLSNYFFGLWQVDPIIGIFIGILLVKEGYEIFEEE
ncbi:MAG: cation transporter [Methanobacterium sp.]|uniref:cation diffusion facilitator family transporter n=1 Tax=Methanobacterium sp. TaxID=2164 RepID=UPI003D656844|nr:cation transporter [Methanobacterium sp.]